MTGEIFRYSYAVNQWNSPPTRFVRLEQQTRALKTCSVLGFDAIELQGGSGRWNNLGRPEHIRLSHGSLAGFVEFLAASGIRHVSSMTWDPTAPAEEEGGAFRSTSDAADHAAILAAAEPFLDFLAEVGAETFVVRAAESAWRLPEGGRPDVAAALFDALGAAAAGRGIRLAVDVDCLSAFRPAHLRDELLAATDPAVVGLNIDTAELTISGADPTAVLRAHGPRIAHVQLKDTVAVDAGDDYRLPHAETAVLQGDGGPRIERWFYELGTQGGLVSVAETLQALRDIDYRGWVVVESDQSPTPAATAMLNAWYLMTVPASGFPGGRR
jgi:inosose dehydratase